MDHLTPEAPGLAGSRFPGATLPLIVNPSGAGDGPDLAARRAWVERELSAVGALLFRGFPLASVADFQRFVKALTPELLEYEFGSTPRSRIEGRVYTSTEYPAHQHIPLHNEQSYTSEWPLKLWFHCAEVARQGGNTPLADSRALYRALSPALRERFANKRVMYVRNYGNGLDLPWQNVFGTSDRREVESFCRRAGISWEWKDDGELRTRQVCQAIASHPYTGDLVWFNQAHLFHVSNLEPRVREGLLAALSEQDLPRHAYYGDGAAIEPAALDEIRELYRVHALEFAWRQGDVLLLDNMLVAHGRAPYQGTRKVLVAMAEPYRAPSL